MPYQVNPFVEFNGRRYFFQRVHGYYKTSRQHGGRLLHRDVWEAAHGPIPAGWHVHHIDEDRGNNDLSNLQAVSPRDHKRIHGPTGTVLDDGATRSLRRRAEWAQRQPRDVVCVECGATYQSTGQRAKFCGRRCCRRHYARNAAAGVQPHG